MSRANTSGQLRLGRGIENVEIATARHHLRLLTADSVHIVVQLADRCDHTIGGEVGELCKAWRPKYVWLGFAVVFLDANV